MRDILLTVFTLGLVPFILIHPHIGVLAWSWLSYMNPHRLTWGFAYSMPFAEIIAIATLVSIVLTNERRRLPVVPLTVLWGLFVLWIGFSTLNATVPGSAWAMFDRVIKIQLIAFITVMLMASRERLTALVWVIVISIGFYSFKGGLFTILSGGTFRVWGPSGTMIEDNNALALATLMILPLVYYLYTQSRYWWVKLVLAAGGVLSLFSVLGSHSRGAIVAGTTVLLFFWLKSKHKLMTVILLAAVVPVAIVSMPEAWTSRISTIYTDFSADPLEFPDRYNIPAPIPSRDVLGWWPDDASFIGRVNAWNYAVNIAGQRITGGGLESWKPQMYQMYAPIPEMVRSSHSIYFGVLADQGWPGLALYLLIGLTAWRAAGRVVRSCRHRPDLDWLVTLARMLQVCLIAYASGGAFLSLAYFDLPWHIISMTVLCQVLAAEYLARPAPAAGETAPAAPRRGRPAPRPPFHPAPAQRRQDPPPDPRPRHPDRPERRRPDPRFGPRQDSRPDPRPPSRRAQERQRPSRRDGAPRPG